MFVLLEQQYCTLCIKLLLHLSQVIAEVYREVCMRANTPEVQLFNMGGNTNIQDLQSLMIRAIFGFSKMQSPITSCNRWQQHFTGLKCAGRNGTSSSLNTPSWLLAVSLMIISVTLESCQSSSSLTIHSAMLLEVCRSEKGTQPRTRAWRLQPGVI